MSEWQPISTAPKNPSGESYGPWLLVFNGHNNSVFQARWECNGAAKGWYAKNEPKGFFSVQVTHWMPLPEPPHNTNSK